MIDPSSSLSCRYDRAPARKTRRHSARFVELTDQPLEIMMAVTEEQADRLFERINATDTRLFYIKAPVEYGQLGKQA
jgi:hypothetical protein